MCRISQAFGDDKPSITDVGFGKREEEQREPLLDTFTDSREGKNTMTTGSTGGREGRSMTTGPTPTAGDSLTTGKLNKVDNSMEPSFGAAAPLQGDEKVREGGTTDLSAGMAKPFQASPMIRCFPDK